MKTEKKWSSHLAGRLFFRMIMAVIAYTFAGFILYFLAVTLYNSRLWTGDEPIYQLVHWADMRRDILALLYLMVGYIAIFSYYWKRPFVYLQEVADAAETLYRPDDSMVQLSAPLSSLEARLNQLKVRIIGNERAAREAEQRKNDLVTYLAHDLKTPITSVIGYLTLLEDEPQISEQTRMHYTAIAREKAERLDDLINEFFEITRFNLSHITLEKTKVHLTRMLEQLIFEFRPMFLEKNLDCTLDAPEDIPFLCDPDKLQRVFDNLLRNAVSYSYENSVIRITARETPQYVKVIFENDGDTIPEEKLQRIFEQFYRLDSSRRTGSGGAGLGLAIAKEITRLHGGTIEAFSADNRIRFEVTFPRSPA